MVKRSSMKKINKLMTLENMLGLLLAVLIVFDLKVEQKIANMVNSPLGMVLSLVVLVCLFVVMSPVVGLLFLIYLYETVKYSSSMIAEYTKPIEKVRHNIMTKLNLAGKGKDSVEIDVINHMAPLIKKGEKMNVKFVANTSSSSHQYHKL